ncbi:hypothetical protein PVAP13_5KG293800, partial [Panicum virgatum]
MAKTVAFGALVAALFLLTRRGGAAAGGPGSSCTRSCGSVSIPYPFGIELGCFHSAGFNLNCNHSYQPPKLFLGDAGTERHEVLDISPGNATVRINSRRLEFSRWRHGSAGGGAATANRTWGADLPLPYFLSQTTQNTVRVEGCNIHVELRGGTDDKLIGACVAICLCPALQAQVQDDLAIRDLDRDGKCEGHRCCEVNINEGHSFYSIQFRKINQSFSGDKLGDVATLDESYNLMNKETPKATLSWILPSNSTCPANGSVSAPECRSDHSSCLNKTKPSTSITGYVCRCSNGYQGNPYVPDGCQDVNECENPEAFSCYGTSQNHLGSFTCQCPDGNSGNPFTKGGVRLGVGIGTSILVVALGAPIITRKIKLRKMKKMRQKYFNQNHGLLLQQLISQNADIGERMIVTLRELEKATNNFDRARVIGGGGHGVVFKGILDLHVVAIKKSKIMVQREIDEFINEVAILSQVNHRNVVKLIGCCFETEVPFLVYEFISNGTLYQHLHVEGPKSLSWVHRIRIALEVARALSYLHSAASIPIFRRDIKSSNILLDDSLIAKVSDFGALRYIPIDQTELTTAVQGTLGRLTEKSDVFSFGVLIELLTRKKPFVYRSVDGDSLISHFEKLLTASNLAGIIDPQVMEEEDGDVQELATLAATCTKLRGEDRPTMREVEMTLENLFVKKK